MNPNPEPARRASGLILPAGYKCEECAARNQLIAHLKGRLEELAGEVDRIHREVGSALSNRSQKREMVNRQRAVRRGRRPKVQLKLIDDQGSAKEGSGGA